jgi:hypothetical protein
MIITEIELAQVPIQMALMALLADLMINAVGPALQRREISLDGVRRNAHTVCPYTADLGLSAGLRFAQKCEDA